MNIRPSAEHIGDKGNTCPVCLSNDLEGDGYDFYGKGGRVKQDVRCHGCGSAWVDVHVLIGYEDLIPNTAYADDPSDVEELLDRCGDAHCDCVGGGPCPKSHYLLRPAPSWMQPRADSFLADPTNRALIIMGGVLAVMFTLASMGLLTR